jgi:hypothetical protein
MGHERLHAWAQAIIDESAGVDLTHPPKTDKFTWLPRPDFNPQTTQITTTATSVNSRGNATNGANVRSTNDGQTSSGRSHHTVQSAVTTGLSPVSGPLNIFNNDRVPLPITGVEQMGKMSDFLANSMIPLSDRHTQILIENFCIHHWTYFRRSTMHELLGMGFSPGPA